uniref:Thyrotropin receptor n=1 Tax=Ascaris suum TaxID=6253 RepID=F1LDL8_ASCSU
MSSAISFCDLQFGSCGYPPSLAISYRRLDIVLATVHHKRMRVHYFFMANLSTADLLTGFYLGMLAVEDVRTSDEYYNYAVNWQTGVGCQIAGFLSVFASEISILSMFFIAFEMWYNTRFAILHFTFLEHYDLFDRRSGI